MVANVSAKVAFHYTFKGEVHATLKRFKERVQQRSKHSAEKRSELSVIGGVRVRCLFRVTEKHRAAN